MQTLPPSPGPEPSSPDSPPEPPSCDAIAVLLWFSSSPSRSASVSQRIRVDASTVPETWPPPAMSMVSVVPSKLAIVPGFSSPS